MKTTTGLLLFILTITIPATLLADGPLPPPAIKEVWSPNKLFCAVMDPKTMTTTIFRIEGDPGNLEREVKRNKQWAMHGWFRVAHLADDGEHLIIGHDGINLLPLDVTKNEPLIRFFKKGKRINVVTLGELVEDQSSLKRTVSHLCWGSYLGLVEGHYAVETVEGRKLIFDVTTGKPLRPAALNGKARPALTPPVQKPVGPNAATAPSLKPPLRGVQ